MRWLKRDEGITMVLVGVSLAVLLALSGMAVDLGAVYAERRELRTGADAAALAIAEDCGMHTRPCDEATAWATAGEYADANAQDGASAVESVELTFTSSSTGSVRVVTSAWDPDAAQSGVRVPLLSLLGFDRVNVGASATAIFDHPASSSGLPLIIGTCEFYTAIQSGFGDQSRTMLVFKDPTKDPEKPCPADPAGKDAPGAFGWLYTGGYVCSASTGTSAPFPQTDPGVSPSEGCYPIDLGNARGTDVLIPLYSDICRDPAGTQCTDADASGSNTYYVVPGFASFHLEHYYLGGEFRYPSSFRCNTGNSADRCIEGYFTTDAVYTGEAGGANYGVALVKLVE
jgi:Putative Flp pilus-assembly TadE/G-like